MARTRYRQALGADADKLEWRARVVLMPTARGMGEVDPLTVIPGDIPVVALPDFLAELKEAMYKGPKNQPVVRMRFEKIAKAMLKSS